MNFFWLIAIVTAGFIAWVLMTGRVRLRGEPLVDRRTQPQLFWFYVSAFAAGLLIVIAEAIAPPY